MTEQQTTEKLLTAKAVGEMLSLLFAGRRARLHNGSKPEHLTEKVSRHCSSQGGNDEDTRRTDRAALPTDAGYTSGKLQESNERQKYESCDKSLLFGMRLLAKRGSAVMHRFRLSLVSIQTLQEQCKPIP